MKYILGIFFFLVLFYGCDNNNPNVVLQEEASFTLSVPATELYQLVGEKHDTAMLLMSTIGKVQSVLRMKLSASETNSTQKDSILNLLTALKKADDGMMDWMRAFKSTELNEEEYKALSEEEIMSYLNEEKSKIEQVHVDMMQSIANGKRYLGI